MAFLVAAATTLGLLSLDGSTLRPDRTPLPGAIVCALPDPLPEGTQAPTACTTSGEKGAFHLQVPAGTYILSALAPGTAGAIARKVAPGTTAELLLAAGGRTVSGRVTLPGGEGASKAWVFAIRKVGMDFDVFVFPTDASGRFRVSLGPEPLLIAAAAGELETQPYPLGGGDVTLELPLPGKPTPASSEVKEWIRAKAVPLATVQAGNGFADMEPLLKVVGEARVVALGEATHGTREFFQLKHRMLEFLVRRMGFTVFGIEASLPDALAVDDYVARGIGDPAQALAGLGFWTWNTEEVLAMIRWMRQYNEDPANARKIRFVGFDMQNAEATADRLARYLERADSRDEVRTLLAPLDPLREARPDGKVDDTTRSKVRAAVEALEARLRERKTAYVAATSPAEHALAVRLVELLRQVQEVVWEDAFDARDRAMADNVRWWLGQEPPGTRMVLWAHNGHVSFDDRNSGMASMGQHLRRALGRDYLVFGFAFDRGSFQAVEQGKGLHPMSVGPAKEESLDAALASAGPGLLALDLRTLPRSGPVAEWFRTDRPARSVGAIFEPEGEKRYYIVQSSPQAYDALLFVSTTSSAVPVGGTAQARRPTQPRSETAANLDFEADLEEGKPPGWFTTTTPGGYRFTIDQTGPAEGKRSGRLDREGERAKPLAFGVVMQSVSAVPFRGRKVRFRASVRAEVTEVGDQAQLWLRVDRENEMGFFDNMQDRPIREPEWKVYEIVGDVAPDAVSLNFGILLAGKGRTWIDGVSLEAMEERP